MKCAYLVHDLNDAAVRRRVRMLQAADVEVTLLGFHRGETAPKEIEGAPVRSFGRTFDAQLGRRAVSVLRRLATAPLWKAHLRGADVILARNLEMLALAAAARGAAPRARLAYEALDIHRSLLGDGRKAKVMRGVERALLRGVDLLLVSSPAFVSAYFEPLQRWRGETLLVENKVLALTGAVATPPPAPAPGPPWRIGWFGMIRCARSLRLLADLARGSDGAVEVVIRGRPALTEFEDFDAAVAAAPGVSFEGPYRAEDLPALYGACHFVWAIDYFEEGLNSAWLLPNRLYEGALHGAVPLALKSVETGRWLAAHAAGVLMDDPAAELAPLFGALTPAAYAALRADVAAIPTGDLAAGRKEALGLARALAGGLHGAPA